MNDTTPEEILAALFPNQSVSDVEESASGEQSPDRAAIAKRHGIPDLADQLRGDTAAELEAFAAAMGALRQREQDLAADPVVRALTHHARKGKAIVDALHPPDKEER